MFSIEKMLEAMREVSKLAAPMPMRIIQIPDSAAPREQYACSLYIAIAHPFWFWLYRKLNWDTRTLYEVIRGYSRPLYRIKAEAYRLPDGTMACTRPMYEELKRQIPAASPARNLMYPNGLYRGLFP